MKARLAELAIGLSIAAATGTAGFATKVVGHMANDSLHVAGVEKRLENMEQQLQNLEAQQREMLRLLGRLEGVTDGNRKETDRDRNRTHRPER